VLLEGLFRDGAEEGFLPSFKCGLEEYEKAKSPKPVRRNRLFGGEAALSKLRFVDSLGKGGFGRVFLVEDSASGLHYALKMISKGHVQNSDLRRQVCWERDLLSMVDSPFVILLHRTFKDEQYVYLLLEAALGGSLFDLLHRRPALFSEDNSRGARSAFYVACVTEALEHLHERHIVYRDLKPENVLLDSSGYAKLCDMGFARFVLGKTNTLAGTPEYMAPEIIDFPHSHDTSVDWWALGVLTYELLTGQHPWDDEGIADMYERLLAIRRSQAVGRLIFPFTCPALAKDFVSRLLAALPHRLGAAEGAAGVKAHSWFRLLRFDFEALRHRSLQSPCCEPGKEPSSAPGCADLNGHWLGGQQDSLFMHWTDDGSRWAEDF